jgi:hypothetical protein
MKRLSDALFLLAVGLVVVAAVTSTPGLYAAAAVALVLSFVVTAVKRRRFRAAVRGTGARQT